MSKVLIKLSLFFIFLILNLFLLPTTSYAAVCGDPKLGITYEPERFISGSPITINFNVSNPNTLDRIKYVRLRFGTAGIGAFGDIYIPNPRDPATAHGLQVTSTTFTFSNIADANSNLRNTGPHQGELQWTDTAGGSFEHNSCPITYRVDPAPATCQIDNDLKSEYQPDTPITVQFGGIPNTRYYLFLLIRGGLGYRSDTRYPVDNITTNNNGEGVFHGVRLRGNQGDQIQLLIDIQQDPDKATRISCSKPITLTIAASPPEAKCYAKPPANPGANYTVRAINLSPSTSYYATLDSTGAVGPTQTTGASGNSATELTFDLGTNTPSIGTHHVTVNQAFTLEEKCSDDFIINPDGSETPVGPEPPSGPVSAPPISGPKGPPATAGGIPCDNNTGFKTAIGCIHTNPIEFTKDFLKFIVGIGGGLAFLMMLLGAFQMLTSAGNPETLQAGRDRLTNAVIGLLFVIFAVLLMQIIGVDILGLPDFRR